MDSLKLYHRLPSFMKDIVASGYGYLQKRKRYGGMFQKFVKQLEESQWYSLDQQKKYQEPKLKSMLIHCSENVPYYRTLFKKIAVDPNKEEPFSVLSRLPVLDKQTVRENSQQFIAENISQKKMTMEHTSGSTGTPLKVFYTNEAHQFNYALHETRFFNLAGVKHDDRKVMFGGRLVTPVMEKKPPFWVKNYAEKQLYCSSYHISSSTLPYYHKTIVLYRPKFITGYTSAIYLYAHFLLDIGEKIDGLKAVLLSSESLYPKQRETMEKAFGCKVYDGYSLAEYVNWISECEYQTLHISPEAGVIEILENDYKGIKSNLMGGEIISTTLFNYAMPLLRYRTGDIAVKSKKKCSCGRALPVIEKIIGRTDDYIITPDGIKVGRLDPIFKGVKNIVEAQIIQEDKNNINLLVIPDSNFCKKDADEIIRNLQSMIGNNFIISMHKVSNIKRNVNGKFKSVICKIN